MDKKKSQPAKGQGSDAAVAKPRSEKSSKVTFEEKGNYENEKVVETADESEDESRSLSHRIARGELDKLINEGKINVEPDGYYLADTKTKILVVE